jgi:Domain of unknown function (DUF397)
MDQRDQPTLMAWRKSSHSEAGNCVEVAYSADSVFVRDSKDPTGPVLCFSRLEWAALVSVMKLGNASRRPQLT